MKFTRSNQLARKLRQERAFQEKSTESEVLDVIKKKKLLRILKDYLIVFFSSLWACKGLRNQVVVVSMLCLILVSNIFPSFVALSYNDQYIAGDGMFNTYEDNSIDALLQNSDNLVADENGVVMNTIMGSEASSTGGMNDIVEYVVQEGDTLSGIADRFDISMDTIAMANNLKTYSSLKQGQLLKIIPVDGILYQANKDENLSDIAKKYGIDVNLIAEQNNITANSIIKNGQQLILPGAKFIKTDTAKQTVLVASNKTKEIIKKSNNKTIIKGTKNAYVATKPEKLETTKGRSISWPTVGSIRITQKFHYGHPGVDIQGTGSTRATAIVAVLPGKVIQAASGWNGGYGNVIVIDHGNGMQTRYAHLKEIYVSAGQQVSQGQKIAWMGNTGRVYGQTGIHIHFEVIVNKVRQNPMNYL